MAFITEIASYIKENYDLSKESLTIIFPNKRAALKLRTELINSKFGTNIWLPQILSIQEAMCSWSGLQLLDNIDIIFELIKIVNKAEKIFSNDIYGLASQMLKDFDEIDQYAVDAKSLFQNTKDAKEIDLQFLNEDYVIDRKHIEFFASLNEYYESLRKVLLENKSGYYGLITRHIYDSDIDNLREMVGNRKIIFAGFNAMTKTEEGIIVRLIQENIATLLWDLDEYYFNDSRQEAGIFAREFFERNKHIQSIKRNFIGNKLVTDKKNIDIIGASGAVIQTNALQLELHNESKDNDNEVIVLSDESMLIPVLNCIPSGKSEEMQVTMGFPYSTCILNQFLQHLFVFQKNIRNNNKGIYFWSLVRLLNSELIKIIFTKEELKHLFNWKNENIKKSAYYISTEDFESLKEHHDIYDFLCLISKKWNSNNECISSIKSLLKAIYKKVKINDKTNFISNQISVAGRIINKIEKLLNKYEDIIQIADIENLYRQSSSEMTINLKGDYGGLQIMGLLETRNLDFKTVHILSVNEGILPQSKNASSLIPFDLRKYYGLPTYNNKQAVYAYHFYRLLQNAENIKIYYNTLADGMGEGESSRFIKQIIHEMPSKNPNANIKEKIYKSPSNKNKEIEKIEAKKTDEVYDKIIKKLSFVSEDKKSGLSPTSISCYLKCPLKFYLKYIEKINDDIPQELIQSNVIGTIIHAALENLYKYFGSDDITLERYQEVYAKYFNDALKKALADNNFPNGLPHSGFNYLSSKMMDKMIENFIKQEIKFLKANKSMKIIGLEENLFASIYVPEHKTNVNLTGNADRIDQVGNTIRIIDYKSGSVNDSDVVIKKNVNELKDLSEKSLQLLIYKYLYKKAHNDIAADDIEPGIIGLRKISKGVFSLSNNSSLFIGENLTEDFESKLSAIYNEILDKDIPFKQTEDENKCLNCSFVDICKRNPKKHF
jgi:CRISPR/Cas system-associated exonuclease Cas4 (RecB family)